MKIGKSMVIVGLSVLFVLGISILALLVSNYDTSSGSGSKETTTRSNDVGNNIFADPDNPVISPSGRYQLQVAEGFNGLVHFNRFYIAVMKETGLDPEVTYCSKDTFRTQDTLLFLWDKNDRVWVYSGDVGTFYWEKGNDNEWHKNAYANKKIPVPEALRKALPNRYKEN